MTNPALPPSTLPPRAAPAAPFGTIALPAAAPLGAASFAAVAYLMAVGAAAAAWQAPWPTASAVALGWAGFLPAAVALGFVLKPAAERQQQVARLLAVVLMAPVLLLFLLIDGVAGWNAGTGAAVAAALAHAGCFVAAIRWVGAETTRLQPAPGVSRVDRSVLQRRLLSLGRLGLPLDLHAAPDGAVHLRWHPHGTEARLHTVRLHVEPGGSEVDVRERVQARGARPLDAAEASMRRIGEPRADAARPRAQRVWNQTLQSTLLDPARVAGVPVAMDGHEVRWTGTQPPTLPDTDALMTLLAAVVLRSGHTWAPRLAG